MAENPQQLTAAESADRLDKWLAAELGISRSKVTALFKEERVTLSGAVVRPSRSVAAGECFDVRIPDPPVTRLVEQDIDLEVLYEDASVIVVNKQAGLVVHPGRGNPDGTLCNAILGRLTGLPGHPERPGIVHRLDKGTSGVIVVAKTQAALEHLAAQFSEHSVDRRYLALVWGYVQEEAGTIDQPLARHPRDRIRFAVVKGGKRAVTHWRVLGRANFKVPSGMGNVTLVECRLETGRTHQIRVHMSELGHPLVGDPVYQRPLYKPRMHAPPPLRDALSALDHQLLHARLLGFEHPVEAGRIENESTVPKDFQAVLDAVGIVHP